MVIEEHLREIEAQINRVNTIGYDFSKIIETTYSTSQNWRDHFTVLKMPFKVQYSSFRNQLYLQTLTTSFPDNKSERR